MATYDLGKVVGEDGTDGATIWTTSTAPSTPDYTFTITNLTGPSGATVKAGDIIIYSYYWYSVTSVSSTTVLAGNRTNIRGATGATGSTGATGNGISSISKTGTSGLVDTYTITYTNGNTATFTVTNGSDASVTIVTSFGSTTSDSKVPSEKLVKTSLDAKVAKSNTSGLLKNDGTVDTSTYLTSSALSNYVQKSNTTGLLKNDGTVDTTSYSTFSGSYSDLTNKPSIPSSSSDLSDGSSLVKTSSTSGLLKNDGSVMTSGTGSSNWAVGNHTHTKSQVTDFPSLSTVATSGSYSDLSNKPSIPSSSSDLSDGSSLIKTSSTTGLLKNDGSVMTSGTGSSNWATGNHTHSGMLTSSDIADNLTTNDATKVLSAKQGKILYDLITSIEEDMLL